MRRGAGHRSGQGFSLIEVMVVLLILGLGVSLVSFSVGGNEAERQLSEAAEFFSARAKLAADEAVMGGEAIGLTIVPAVTDSPWQYYWQRYRDGSWQPLDEPLDMQELSPLIELEMVIEGQLVDWTQLPEPEIKRRRNPLTDESVEVEEIVPLAVYYPSGEATTFALTFASASATEVRQQVRTSPTGRVEWRETGDERF